MINLSFVCRKFPAYFCIDAYSMNKLKGIFVILNRVIILSVQLSENFVYIHMQMQIMIKGMRFDYFINHFLTPEVKSGKIRIICLISYFIEICRYMQNRERRQDARMYNRFIPRHFLFINKFECLLYIVSLWRCKWKDEFMLKE